MTAIARAVERIPDSPYQKSNVGCEAPRASVLVHAAIAVWYFRRQRWLSLTARNKARQNPSGFLQLTRSRLEALGTAEWLDGRLPGLPGYIAIWLVLGSAPWLGQAGDQLLATQPSVCLLLSWHLIRPKHYNDSNTASIEFFNLGDSKLNKLENGFK